MQNFQLTFSFYITEYITKNEQSYSAPQMETRQNESLENKNQP